MGKPERFAEVDRLLDTDVILAVEAELVESVTLLDITLVDSPILLDVEATLVSLMEVGLRPVSLLLWMELPAVAVEVNEPDPDFERVVAELERAENVVDVEVETEWEAVELVS